MSMQKILELKRIVATPAEEKPKFDWKRLISEDKTCSCNCYSIDEIAEKIGEAIVNAELAAGNHDIFSDENKRAMIGLTKQVCHYLDVREPRLPSQAMVNGVIEEILVRNSKLDVASAFVAKCKFDSKYYSNTQEEHSLNLIRRDGSVVPWNADKIRCAVEKAFVSQHQNTDRAEQIACAVTKTILDEGLSFVHIENVQDRVQEELMRHGEYKVAEAYILYRAERAKLREIVHLEDETRNLSSPDPILLIKGPNGGSFFWDGSELRERIKFASAGLDSHISFDEIFLLLREDIPSDIDIFSLRSHVIKNARRLIEKDPMLAVFAARMQLLYLYEDVIGWDCATEGKDVLAEKHASAFINYVKMAVQDGLLHPDMLKYDLRKLANALNINGDLDFDAIALQSMQDHYFICDVQDKILETPQMLWMRVAMGVFLAKEGSLDDVIALYKLMSERKFCLATPTLYYAGTPKAQMMSSYVFHLEDDMQSIMTRGISDNASIAKWGGGIAGSWSNVRGKGARIYGTRGRAPGVIPFLQLHQHQLAIANQGHERRRGRGAAYLEIWHSDIIDFVNYKKEYGFAGVEKDALGTVVWVPDIFMRRLENDADWTLIDSEAAAVLHEKYGAEFDKKYEKLEKLVANGELSGRQVSCRDIWQKIMQRIFETGYPKIAFKDTCNRANMCKNGIIHAAGLCLEHFMNTNNSETAVSNTGAIDISKHLTELGELNQLALQQTVRVAIRAMDAMIDSNFFPSDASKVFAKKYRAVGLGMMGLQNAFYHMDLPFGSDEAMKFGELCTEIISYTAIDESCDLAAKYGSCEVFESSEWKNGKLPADFSNEGSSGQLDWSSLRNKIKQYGIRNAYLMAFSPTRKIARLLGCYPELSPATKNVFTKRFDDNYEMMIISPELVRSLKKAGVWNKSIHKQIRYFEGELAAIDGIPEEIKEVFSTAYMIDSEVIIDAAARRQKWIDQSQSLRLFLGTPSLKTLSDMFILAWRKGIKGVYEVKSAGFFFNSISERQNSRFSIEGCCGAHNSDGADTMVKILEKLSDPR